MESYDHEKREIERKEAELQAREQDLRLRELEAEIYRNDASQDPPLSPTKKHPPSPRKLALKWQKIVKFTKFLGFTLLGIALLRLGLTLGVWLSYLVVVGLIAFVGYKIFFEDNQS